jgi:hypothetical protein
MSTKALEARLNSIKRLEEGLWGLAESPYTRGMDGVLPQPSCCKLRRRWCQLLKFATPVPCARTLQWEMSEQTVAMDRVSVAISANINPRSVPEYLREGTR